MSKLNNPFADPSGKKPTCLQMLQTIIDGEATKVQEEYFKQHMDECMPCYKTFQVDMQIRQLLKTKCCGGEVPNDLIEKIKSQVNSIS